MANTIYTRNTGILVSKTLLQENSVLLDPNTNNIVRRVTWCIPPSVTLSMQSTIQKCATNEGDNIKVVPNDSTTTPIYISFDIIDDTSKNLLDLTTSIRWSTSAPASYILYID